MRLRVASMGLSTLLGLAPKGFFIPYRYAAGLPRAGQRRPYEALAPVFTAAEAAFEAHLRTIEGYCDALLALGGAPPPAPRFDQDWFPSLDGAAAYAMVRSRRPARIVEVGSGHSTRFLARAALDEGHDCRILAIDPAPRATLDGLEIEIRRQSLAATGLAPFSELGPGDFVVVDSSHILMPGSDVDDILNRILPGLPAGVLVHFHDVFLPDDYPAGWAWRGYNEQSALGSLVAGGGWELLFASHWVATRMAPRLATSVVARLPTPPGARFTSFWLAKR
jgi:hypothetical protein